MKYDCGCVVENSVKCYKEFQTAAATKDVSENSLFWLGRIECTHCVFSRCGQMSGKCAYRFYVIREELCSIFFALTVIRLKKCTLHETQFFLLYIPSALTKLKRKAWKFPALNSKLNENCDAASNRGQVRLFQSPVFIPEGKK